MSGRTDFLNALGCHETTAVPRWELEFHAFDAAAGRRLVLGREFERRIDQAANLFGAVQYRCVIARPHLGADLRQRRVGLRARQIHRDLTGVGDGAFARKSFDRIMDLKAPASGEHGKNRWENLELLTDRDELKFVLASRQDYDWAVSACRQRRLFELCPVLFSPVQGQLDPAQLAQWILDDRLPLRFQLQLHKVLWGSAQGR